MNWVMRALIHDALDEYDKAIDIVFDGVDNAFQASKFDEIDAMLREVNIDAHSIDLLLGWLTSTLPARKLLPYRPEFFAKVKQSIEARGRNTEVLLYGLE